MNIIHTFGFDSDQELSVYENEEFACNHKDITAIHPSLLTAIEEDKKTEVNLKVMK